MTIPRKGLRGYRVATLGSRDVTIRESERSRNVLWGLIDKGLPKRMYGLLIVPHTHEFRRFASCTSRHLQRTDFDFSVYFGLSGQKNEDINTLALWVSNFFGERPPENKTFHDGYSYKSFFAPFFYEARGGGLKARYVICQNFPYLNTCSGQKMKMEDINSSMQGEEPRGWFCAASKVLSAAIKDFGHLLSYRGGNDFFNWVQHWELTEISNLEKNTMYPQHEQAPSCATCQKHLPYLFKTDFNNPGKYGSYHYLTPSRNK